MDQPEQPAPSPAVETDQDTGDLISRDLPDPPPAEITDPEDPSWVEPAADARAVDPGSLLPHDSPPPADTDATVEVPS